MPVCALARKDILLVGAIHESPLLGLLPIRWDIPAEFPHPTARAIRESPLRFSAKNTQNGSRFARIPLSAEMSGLSPTSLTLAQADRLVR